MKKIMSMLLVSMMLVSMVGCGNSFEEGYEPGKEAVNSSKEKSTTDEYMEEDEEEYEEYEEEEQETEEYEDEEIEPTDMDTVVSTVYEILNESYGSGYTVEVVMQDDYNCNIAIRDNSNIYSTYSKSDIEAMAEDTGLKDTMSELAGTIQDVFREYGYNVTVMIGCFGADNQPFMMVNATGFAIYY